MEVHRALLTEKGRPPKTAERARRYTAALADPFGPIDPTILPFDLLADEPLYQLVRLQLLAYTLETARMLNADWVRVLHVTTALNDLYPASLSQPEHRALGATVSDVWQSVLRQPTRFLSVDIALFTDPAATSAEYAQRYGDDVIDTPTALCASFDITGTEQLEHVLYAEEKFDGDVIVTDEGIELLVGGVGTVLTFPFTAGDLRDAAHEDCEA